MSLVSTERRGHLTTAGIGTALMIVMGAVLIFGFRLATHMRSNIGACRRRALCRATPTMIARQLNTLRDRLEERAYSGQALADLRAPSRRFDQELRRLSAAGDLDSPQLGQALLLWNQYAPVLDPVITFNGQPYVDSDDGGSSLSRDGHQHYADGQACPAVRRRQCAGAAARSWPPSPRTLQHTASDGATRLRTLLLVGVIAALVLAAAAIYFQLTRVRHERAAHDAQEQTRDILKTVQEGFFLLDADYRIGTVWSEALTRMFGR